MTTSITFLAAALGTGAGAVCIPLTRHQLAGAMGRAGTPVPATSLLTTTWHRVALVVASGILPGAVLWRVGWSPATIPPLLLLLALLQLGWCDLTRRLLPRGMVHVTTALVVGSAAVVAGVFGDWPRLEQALFGGAALFGLLFAFNLMNPAWIAFGDVRLAFVAGFGLTWIAKMAVLEGLFLANFLAAVVGIALIAMHRAERRTGLPFGFYLAVATALTIVWWS